MKDKDIIILVKLIDHINNFRNVEDDIDNFIYKSYDIIIINIPDYTNAICHTFKLLYDNSKFNELNKYMKYLKIFLLSKKYNIDKIIFTLLIYDFNFYLNYIHIFKDYWNKH